MKGTTSRKIFVRWIVEIPTAKKSIHITKKGAVLFLLHKIENGVISNAAPTDSTYLK